MPNKLLEWTGCRRVCFDSISLLPATQEQRWANPLIRKHLTGFSNSTIFEANTKTPSIPTHPSRTSANQ